MRINVTCLRRAMWLGMLVAAAVPVAALTPGTAHAQADQPDARFAPPTEEAQPVKLGEYWIGVACNSEPLDKTLRAQLGLADDQGLAVLSVMPDSPAAKAGMQENDILLTAGDKSLGKIQDLVDAVDAAKDQELSMVLVRDGAKTTLTVKPEKRPAQQQQAAGEDADPQARLYDPESQQLWRWFERWQADPNGGRRMVIPGPGFMLPPGTSLATKLPKDMSVTITKEGEQPARIAVKQGDKSWEVTEDKLGDLPEEVRGHVEALLGRTRLSLRLHDMIAPPQVAERPRIEVVPRRPGGDDPRINEIQEQLEKLRQAVEALEKKLSPPDENK